jgi:hypothetical protein
MVRFPSGYVGAIRSGGFLGDGDGNGIAEGSVLLIDNISGRLEVHSRNLTGAPGTAWIPFNP